MKLTKLKFKTRKQLDKLFAGLSKDQRTLIDDTLCGNSSFKSKEDMIFFIADACEDFDDNKLWNMREWTKYNLMYYVATIK